MATDKQIAANRANALKSTGPSSPQGLARSSQNSLRHGLLAEIIVMEGESPERLSILISTLMEEFDLASPSESALVESMAVARWRQMRLWSIEKANLSHEIRRQQSDPTNVGAATHDSATQAALAFRALCDRTRSLDLMNRYETHFERQYFRAFDRLTKLQQKSNFAKRTQLDDHFDLLNV